MNTPSLWDERGVTERPRFPPPGKAFIATRLVWALALPRSGAAEARPRARQASVGAAQRLPWFPLQLWVRPPWAFRLADVPPDVLPLTLLRCPPPGSAVR